MARASSGRAAPAKAKPGAASKKPKLAGAKTTSGSPEKQGAAVKRAAALSALKTAGVKKAGLTKAGVTKVGATKAGVTKVGVKKTPGIAAKAVAARKAVAGASKPAARQVAPPIKAAVAVKKAVPRRASTRTAVPAPAARRARAAVPVRKVAAAPRLSAPQVFTVSHLNQDDFKVDGLRAYARYRDLGIAAATGGLCQAHVIRFTPPCTDEVRKRHLHQTDLQLVYVLQGWMKNEFEGLGEQMMSAGSCWLQPSGIKHTVLDYSADCEVLEIIVPADFKTEELT